MKRISWMAIVFLTLAACASAYSIATELTQAQAIARARSVLRSNASACRITRTQSVTAVRVRAGWRVTARILMSASGTSRSERPVWIVSQVNGAVAQDQLTAEIAMGCP